ncbi:N-acetylglucosaminidase [Bacillus paranthracis]|uniref:N-acetylglucosaminidase n=1 Tax=Bacillus paranthracis TaxID=2026186 RepID=UPI0022E505B0|nr:glucosaminidase domain-containing protein [Bacillus paranthracis]
MEQEIGIKLKADTSDAIRSVKDLEKAVSGMDNVKRKGDYSDGFLSDKDIQQFERMSKQAEGIYRTFFRQYEQMKQEFDRKKSELENSMRNSNNQTEIDKLKRELAQVEAQRVNLQSQHTIAQQLQQRASDTSQQVGGMQQQGSGGLTALLGNGGTRALTALASMLAVGKLWNFGDQGRQMVKSEEEQMAQLGNRMGGYNGKYDNARKDAMETGMYNGYKAKETMEVADVLTSTGGAKDKKTTWEEVKQTQTASRAMGIDATALAQSSGTLKKLGALQDGEQRKFANLLAGAIKKEGMQGRDRELVDAISGLSTQAAQGQLSLSQQELQQMVGMSAMLGSKEEGFKGQRGADLLANMDASIKNGDNRMDVLLGWGTEFQGVKGRAQLERMKAKGITDPENVKRIFSNIDKYAGGNKDAQALLLSELFNTDIEKADRLLKPDIMEELKKGGVSKEEMEKLVKSGEGEISKKSKDYSDSDAARRAKNDAHKEKTQKWFGEKVDAVWEPMKEAFFSMPEWAQWGTMGAGAAGSMWAGKKALGMFRGGGANGGFMNNMKNVGSKAWEGAKNIGSKAVDATKWVGSKAGDLFKSGGAGSKAVEGAKAFGSKVGDFFKGSGGKAATAAGEAGGWLKGAGSKVIAPLASATSMITAADWGTDVGDWLFGHSKGDIKQKKMLDNPFSKHETWKDDRKSAFRRGWEWLTGEDNKAEAATLSPKEAEALKKPKKAEEEKPVEVKVKEESKDHVMTPKAIEPGQGLQNLKKAENQVQASSTVTSKDKEKEEKEKKAKRAQEELLDKERKNLDKREQLSKTDSKTQEQSKRNNEAQSLGFNGMSAMKEKKEDGFFTKMFKSIGGFFGGIGDGIMGLFGGGDSASADSGGGTMYTNNGKASGDYQQYRNQNLKQKSSMSVAEVDAWINSKAPQGSIMRGKGAAFVKASQESGLDVRYLVAHAAEETGWGTSNIAKKKGNMFGIGAYDSSPMASAYQFGGVDAGIVEGAKWIAKNYVNKGQDTIYKMRWNNGQHEYATNSDWDTNIAKIMATAPATRTLNVKVSGGVQGLTQENNNAVTKSLTNAFSAPNLAYEFTQGVGGNR